VKADPVGAQSMLEDLLFPDSMVLHLGNQQHTVAYPTTRAYQNIMETVKQRTIEGFRRTNPSAVNVNWDDVRNKQLGVEIRFRDGIPLNILQRAMQIRGELPIENDLITRIWIFAKDTKDDVRTMFFTDTSTTLYEAIKADFTVADIEKFTSVEESWIPYQMETGDYYLPTKPLTIPSFKLRYTQFTTDELKRNFFVDPAVTRNLMERDGSEIYTDGKRGLQIKNDQHWLNFSDPVASVETRTDMRENLVSALQFVNQHGGWNGKYALYKVPQRMLVANQAFVFRQYYESLPVINRQDDKFGYIRILMQKGIVANFERSMINPDIKSVTPSEGQLSGGEELAAELAAYPRQSSVLTVFPAYRPVLSDMWLQLIPAWAVELRDGTYDYIE
jgi:regulatory protein YycH of two-component signal transduction system YycFG